MPTLQRLEVDANRVDIVEMNGSDAADALERGEVAMACAFGGPLARMRELGDELMSAAEQEAIGIRVFDVVVAPEEFVEGQPDLMRKFMAVTDGANAAYRADPSRYEEAIAEGAGTDLETTKWLLATFSFPSAQEQKSSAWMGGTAERLARAVAEFFTVSLESAERDSAGDNSGAFLRRSHTTEAENFLTRGEARIPIIDTSPMYVIRPKARDRPDGHRPQEPRRQRLAVASRAETAFIPLSASAQHHRRFGTAACIPVSVAGTNHGSRS